jgi:hypothetical protein
LKISPHCGDGIGNFDEKGNLAKMPYFRCCERNHQSNKGFVV